MEKRVMRWAAGLIVVAEVAAAGLGVHLLGGRRGTPEPEAALTGPEAEQVEASPAPAADEESDAEYEEFMAWLEAEAARKDEAEAAAVEAPVEEAAESAPIEEEAAPAVESPRLAGLFAQMGGEWSGERGEGGGNMPRWRAIWSDLRLTTEEQSRLRQGFGLLMARWAAMPPEERAAEQARLQDLRMRWEPMDDDEKAAASQRVRDRFEEWRMSGQVELPELTLD